MNMENGMNVSDFLKELNGHKNNYKIAGSIFLVLTIIFGLKAAKYFKIAHLYQGNAIMVESMNKVYNAIH